MKKKGNSMIDFLDSTLNLFLLDEVQKDLVSLINNEPRNLGENDRLQAYKQAFREVYCRDKLILEMDSNDSVKIIKTLSHIIRGECVSQEELHALLAVTNEMYYARTTRMMSDRAKVKEQYRDNTQ